MSPSHIQTQTIKNKAPQHRRLGYACNALSPSQCHVFNRFDEQRGSRVDKIFRTSQTKQMRTPLQCRNIRSRPIQTRSISQIIPSNLQISSIFNPLKGGVAQMLRPRVRSSRPELWFSLPLPNLLLRAAMEPQSSSSSFSSTLI